MRRFRFLTLLFVPLLLAQLSLAQQPAPADAAPSAGAFRVVFDPEVVSSPYSGRVYIVLSADKKPEPRQRMGDWFQSPQVFSADASAIAPGGTFTLNGANALAFPKAFAETAAGPCYAQAIARNSPDSPSPGKGPGDLYSEPIRVDFTPGAAAAIDLHLVKTVKERPFKETDRVKLVDIVSPSLSKFYGREIHAHAGVVLPEDWKDDAGRHYPTIYFITGFGGDHRSAAGMQHMVPADAAKDILFVVPDPNCFLGHSVFADSANNGPRGQSLMEELIPEIEKRFHGAQDASRRYVTGMSSGGWGSLWLQVAYPDAFAGCWSHCPDPVDFHDFQRIDLYAPGVNMYKDEQGACCPLARQGDTPMLYYDDFVRQETVMGPGGQIHSFEAVFSPKGPDGNPVPLFDRKTGDVDANVAKTWEAYDIRLILERNWATLGPKLKGKLHIYAGGLDTFYLDGAARRLKESLEKLGSDAEFVIVPGMSHMMHQPGIADMFKTVMERNTKQ